MTLEDQIRERWGKYGDWKAAGQDQVAALAKLLRQNGINDLSQFSLKQRDYAIDVPASMVSTMGDATQEYLEPAYTKRGRYFEALNGDQIVKFLGNINNDGSYSSRDLSAIQDAATTGYLNNGDLLGWSSAGHGNTSFKVVNGPDGQPVVVPTWASSSQNTYEDIRGWATLAAIAAGGAYAAQGAGSGAGAAAGGADAATSAAWANGSGLGLDTVSAVGGAGGAGGTVGTAGGLASTAGTLSAESLGAIDGLSSLGTEIGSIGADSIISGTQATTAGGTAGTAGLSSLDKAALYGAEGYGTGMTGAQTSVYDGVLGATGSADLAGALSGNETIAGGLNSVVDGAKTVTSGSGFDTLGKVVTTAVGAGAGADALSNPVDTSRFDQLFSNLLAEQGKSSARAEDEWQNYINTWRPIQQKLADAVTNFDTAGRREMAAQEATGEVATQFDRQRVDAGKRMVAAGVDPSTIAALDASSRIDEAKIQAGAANKARSDIEMKGLSLLQGGANFGRNVANTSAQQSSIATGTTGTANSVLNTQGNLQNQNTANNNALVGDLFQTGMQLWGLSDAKKTGTGG